MFNFLLVIDVIVSITLIGLILVQHGKGADVGAAFGSGASQTVFGSQGSASFLTRSTAILALAFFLISLALAYLTGQTQRGSNVADSMPAEQSAPPNALPAAVPDLPAQSTTAPADVPTLPRQKAATGQDPQISGPAPASSDVPAAP